MKQPILGLFREHRDIETFDFKARHYEEAYNEIIDRLNEMGVYVAMLMGQGTYEGGGSFTKHWVQVRQPDGTYVYEKKGPITVDAIFDKDHFKDDGKVLKVNNDTLYRLCWSKEKTYEVLGEFHPKSLLVNDEAELDDALITIPGERVAVKTLTGSSGLGVFVGSKVDVHAEQELLQYPLLVQEFIETSGGVPGITKSRHDVRVVLLNGKAVIATLRTPPEGELKSNIGYGGHHRLLSVDELPSELIELCHAIDKKLKNYGNFRIYSVDCGLTPNGWRMFEANGMPGVINRGRGDAAIAYQEALTDFLKEVALYGQKERTRKES
jgi:glutathione synthase/RimK-type ligase-like ATP-grasp enzyme